MIFVLEQNPSELVFENNKIKPNTVSIEKFTRYTKDEKQNRMVKVAKELTDVLEKIAEFDNVYLGTIAKGTSGFVIHDQRRNELVFNTTKLKRTVTT